MKQTEPKQEEFVTVNRLATLTRSSDRRNILRWLQIDDVPSKVDKHGRRVFTKTAAIVTIMAHQRQQDPSEIGYPSWAVLATRNEALHNMLRLAHQRTTDLPRAAELEFGITKEQSSGISVIVHNIWTETFCMMEPAVFGPDNTLLPEEKRLEALKDAAEYWDFSTKPPRSDDTNPPAENTQTPAEAQKSTEV